MLTGLMTFSSSHHSFTSDLQTASLSLQCTAMGRLWINGPWAQICKNNTPPTQQKDPQTEGLPISRQINHSHIICSWFCAFLCFVSVSVTFCRWIRTLMCCKLQLDLCICPFQNLLLLSSKKAGGYIFLKQILKLLSCQTALNYSEISPCNK